MQFDSRLRLGKHTSMQAHDVTPTVLAGSHVTYPRRNIPDTTIESGFLCVVGVEAI
jgi:hypothetical protein